MAEYRRDPIVDRWVIVAPERARRPYEFVESPQNPSLAVDPPRELRRAGCPFCEGNECDTTPEEVAVRETGSKANGPGWQVRIVPNLYPALVSTAVADVAAVPTSPRSHERPTLRLPARGRHEVVIESPEHRLSSGELTGAHWRIVWRTIRDRFRALRDAGDCRYVQWFKNVGRAAGASLEHLHSQLMALDRVPPDVAAESAAAEAHERRTGGCLFCDLVERELAGDLRVVEVSEAAAAFCPNAPRFSYETWVVPRRHASRFEDSADDELDATADLLHRTLRRVENSFPNSAYNVVLHTAPFDRFQEPHYHWHWEILPRLTTAAGFEWGTGIHINPVPPEEAAASLRRINLG